ncbi:MAG: CHASE2 domain-containing protein [Gammaproteobacteria bacterium]
MKNLLGRIGVHGARIGLGLAVLVLFIFHAANWLRLGIVDRLDNLAYDQRLKLTMPKTQERGIVIVDIDEKSLAAEGRWPWGRDRLARMVERLFVDYDVKLVGFDIVFAEPDNSSGLGILEDLGRGGLAGDTAFLNTLADMRDRLDYDRIFAETLARHPVVLGYYFNMGGGVGLELAKSGALPPPTFVPGTFTGKNIAFRTARGYGANLEQLQQGGVGGGHFNPELDADGVVRRVPMLIEFDGAYYGSLSLEVARRALGAKSITPRFEQPLFGSGRSYPGLEWLTIGTRMIPVDRHVQTLVPYRGKRGSFPYVSATDVLNGHVDAATLKGAIVLVGTTAPGLLDLRSTPVEEVYPGVEVHANLIAGILSGDLKQLPEYTLGAEVVLLLLFGLVMAVVAPLLSPLWATLLALGLALGYLGFNLLVWSVADFVLPLASGLLMLLSMFIVNMSYGYFVETRGKRQLTGLFGHYVPPALVDEMARSPDAYSLDAESREMTVLFSDVRGFTTISEGLNPKELSALMNQFLTPMTRVIHERRGTIDKYMGDAIMAFWGAPLEDHAHALHAVQAGLDMLAKVEEINRGFRTKGWPEIRIGIGINTGSMSVGNMGSEFRVAYTALGDAVNLGSRLEGLTKNYGAALLVSETTKEAVPEYAYREVDRVRVKGKEQPITIYEPLCLKEDVDAKLKAELKLHRETLRLYRAQEWDAAEVNFLNLQRNSRAPALYSLYISRVAQFRKAPPARDWDGVYTHSEK